MDGGREGGRIKARGDSRPALPAHLQPEDLFRIIPALHIQYIHPHPHTHTHTPTPPHTHTPIHTHAHVYIMYIAITRTP